MSSRRFVSPEPGEDLLALAARVMPGSDAADELLSWNLHLATRPGRLLLPSDVVFIEPPPPRPSDSASSGSSDPASTSAT